MALLSQDSTLSAANLAERIGITAKGGGKTDCQNESGRSTPTNRTGQGRILAGGRKKRIDFFGGSAVCRLPFLFAFQKNALL